MIDTVDYFTNVALSDVVDATVARGGVQRLHARRRVSTQENGRRQPRR